MSRQASKTARRTIALRQDHREAIPPTLGRAAGNGHRVCESLFRRPIVSVAAVRELIGTSDPVGNGAVARLIAAGIRRDQPGEARNWRLRDERYVKVFDSPDVTFSDPQRPRYSSAGTHNSIRRWTNSSWE